MSYKSKLPEQPVTYFPRVFEKDLKIGVEYIVEFKDCCITGFFQSVLVAMEYYEEEPNVLAGLAFANGVVLTWFMGTAIYPAEGATPRPPDTTSNA